MIYTIVNWLGNMPKEKRDITLFMMNIPSYVSLIAWLLGFRFSNLVNIITAITSVISLAVSITVIQIGGWWWTDDED